jgi:transposase
MEVLYPSCCGLDVHKKNVTACVLRAGDKGKTARIHARFGTFTQDLERMAVWLHEQEVTHVAMESTGVYWKPVFNILEGQFELMVVNAQHIKAVPGRKTDQRDSEWIADLLQHGLLRGSFIPPRQTREMRDLTRYRVSLVEELNRIANRIQKVLEDANVKLASVATDVLGASGRAMLEAIVAGEQDTEKLAEMSKSALRHKIPELKRALQGRVNEHHRFLLAHLLDDFSHAEKKIALMEAEIETRNHPFEEAVTRLCTIPGVSRITAAVLLAEIGTDMNQFPSSQQLASWAGLCPGNCESAGKRLSGKTRKGSLMLRRALCQVGWVIARQRTGYLRALYNRLAARRGAKRAIIAVAHAVLVIAYHILRDQTSYRELGSDHFDRIHSASTTRRLVTRLQRLGHTVILQPNESFS